MNGVMFRVILFFLSCVLLSVVHGQVSETERDALIDIYHATGGDDWHHSDGWLGAPGSECEWSGVECSGAQHPEGQFVYRLVLFDNNLTGQLPGGLAGLDRLRSLVVSGNDLEGTLPGDLWGIMTLEELHVADNRFTGAVPAGILDRPLGEFMGNANHLSSFGNANDLDIRDDIDRTLHLDSNELDHLPPADWHEQGRIRRLNMNGNRLEGEWSLESQYWPDLHQLELAGNRLTALQGLDTLSTPELVHLDVSNNRLEHWPVGDVPMTNLLRLRMSGNSLGANWPESGSGLIDLVELKLNDSGLEGPLPDWFIDLALSRLEVENNALEGPISTLFGGMRENGQTDMELYATNNHFHGPVPDDFDYSQFEPGLMRQGLLTLGLCWNDIDIPDSLAQEFPIHLHRGGDPDQCLNRTRQAIDATISGSWFNPRRDGEGITQMLLPDGSILVYWFTYPAHPYGSNRQSWLFEVVPPDESWLEARPLLHTRGRFGSGLEPGRTPEASTIWLRQDRVASDRLHFFYEGHFGAICLTGMCWHDLRAQRYDKQQLTRLAGTACGENRSRFEHFAGAWYNPERVGEGFIVEILGGDRAVVYWFTYRPDDSGAQAWMMGDAEIFQVEQVTAPVPRPSRARVHFDQLVQPQGTRFGYDFDPSAIDKQHWGELTIHFDGDNHGRVEFDSVFEEYGSGEYPIERLARPKLAECEGDD